MKILVLLLLISAPFAWMRDGGSLQRVKKDTITKDSNVFADTVIVKEFEKRDTIFIAEIESNDSISKFIQSKTKATAAALAAIEIETEFSIYIRSISFDTIKLDLIRNRK